MLFPNNYPVRRALTVIQQSAMDEFEDEVAFVRDRLRFSSPAVFVGDAARLNGTIEKINEQILSRFEARKFKKFAESDRIRDELAAMGVVLKDSKDGTTWEIAR